MALVLKNNAATTLASALTSVATTAEVDDGSVFPTLDPGDYFYATIVSSGGNKEIVKVTGVAGDTLTITRAQESTLAIPFQAAARVEMRVTVQQLADHFTAMVTDEVTTQVTDAISLLGTILTPDTPAQGDVIYYDGANYKLLPAGTSGQFLKTQGAGANPVWGNASTDALLIANNLSDLNNAATARTNLGVAIGTNVQAYSANLTTFAGIAPSANVQSILSAANYAAIQALLDVESGTDFLSPAAIAAAYQPLNAYLTDIAGITAAQGDIIYFNGTDWVNLGPGTSGHVLKTQGAGANPQWAAEAGGALNDGDYGDITVGGSGTTMTIDAGVVTLAKMANLNQYELIGRSTAGAGVPQAIATSANVYSILGAADYAAIRALLDVESGTDYLSPAAIAAAYQPLNAYLTDIAGITAAQGDIIYFNGTDWVKLAAGTNGQFLKTQGAAANPTWDTIGGGGDMLAATYDPAAISQQLVGISATQTLTNKTLTTPTITLKQSAAPTPTAEGDIQWDTDDNTLKVGDGASTKTFSDDSKRYGSTGVLTGGVLSTGGGASQYSISDGTGIITDEDGTVTNVSWSGKTNITPANIATNLLTWVSIDSGGNVVEQTTPFTAVQNRSRICLGVAVHVNKSTVDTVNNEQVVAYQPVNTAYDLAKAIGFINASGNEFSANGANLTLDKSAGVIFFPGSNYSTAADNPHNKTLGALTGLTFQYRFSDGSNGATGTNIDPDNLDNGAGGLTAVSNNHWSIQRIYSFISNNVKIQRGVEEFPSLQAALDGLQAEAYVTEQSIADNGLLRAWLIVKKGATALNGADAFFLQAPKFGEIGASSGTSPKNFADDTFTVFDNADNSKIAAFQASGITTGTTRTFTFPDANGTLMLTSAIGATVQAYDADLTTLGAGGSGARDFLGLGTGNTPTFKGVTLTGGTVTVSTPLIDATQTWNDSGVTFTGLKLNVTDTASASGSLLADVSVGGTTQFSVSKGGVVTGRAQFLVAAAGGTSNPNFGWGDSGFYLNNGASSNIYVTVNGAYSGGYYDFGYAIRNAGTLGWESGGVASAPDVRLYRDAAATLAQRNSTNAQTSRVYRTYTDASNYERLALQSGSGYFEVAAETAGTGTDNIDVRLTPAGTGNVKLGVFTLDGDQTVGAGQDNYVLTYDNGTGLISLEAAAGGGNVSNTGTPADNQVAVWTSSTVVEGTSALTFNGTTLGVASGTITTSSKPTLDLSQTWNDGAVTFTGLKLNVTNTASAALSKLLDLQVGGTSALYFTKESYLYSPTDGFRVGQYDTNFTGVAFLDGTMDWYFDNSFRMRVNADRWAFQQELCFGANPASPDLFLLREAADQFAQRRGTNAQTQRIYRTYTDASNYERLALQSGSGYFEVAAETAGTGTDDIDLRLTPAGTGRVLVQDDRISIQDSNASHYLSLVAGSDITADRTLTLTTGDASRTVTLSGDLTVGGTSSINGTAYVASGTDVALADGGTGASLADPNDDRIMFWDDSAGAVTWLDLGSGLNTDITTLYKEDIEQIACSDETTTLTTGTNKATFVLPFNATIVSVGASVNTAPSGGLLTVDINFGGATIMTTNKITIDDAEKTSLTAATAPGLTTTSYTAGTEIGIDIDGVTGTPKGLKVWMIYRRTS